MVVELHVVGGVEALRLGRRAGCRVGELLSVLRVLAGHVRELVREKRRLMRRGRVDDHDVRLLEVLDERVHVAEV